MSALICGSLAYDTIMVFPERFKNHILPDKIHMLNVSFLVPEMRRNFGGCAGNIAYNMKLLGENPLPMGTVGEDFDPYLQRLKGLNIAVDHVRTVPQTLTAQAFITTDLDDNQITAFHPGAMDQSELNQVGDTNGVSIGIVSPAGRAGMVEHAQQFNAANIPFIFDPGQGLPMFDGDDLKQFIELATWVTVNDYEWQLMKDRTGYSSEDVVARTEALIVTRGAEGSLIYTGSDTLEIPVAKPAQLTDPTGCGDAYRGGLLFSLLHQLDWPTAGRVAALMGAIKIECHGTQNHAFTPQEFMSRYASSFGENFEWPTTNA
jgi:adenosine kinase